MLYCKLCGGSASFDELPEDLPKPCKCHTLDEPDLPYLAEKIQEILKRVDPNGLLQSTLDIDQAISDSALRVLMIRECKWRVNQAKEKVRQQLIADDLESASSEELDAAERIYDSLTDR